MNRQMHNATTLAVFRLPNKHIAILCPTNQACAQGEEHRGLSPLPVAPYVSKVPVLGTYISMFLRSWFPFWKYLAPLSDRSCAWYTAANYIKNVDWLKPFAELYEFIPIKFITLEMNVHHYRNVLLKCSWCVVMYGIQTGFANWWALSLAMFSLK